MGSTTYNMLNTTANTNPTTHTRQTPIRTFTPAGQDGNRRVIRATRADIESDAKAIIEVTVVKTDNQVATLETLEKPIAEYMAARLDAACPRAAIEPNLFMVRWSLRTKIFTVSLPAMLQDYILDAGIFKIEHLGSKYAMKPVMADEPTKSGEGNKVSTIYWDTLVTGIKETAPTSAIHNTVREYLAPIGYKMREGRAGFNAILKDGLLTNKYAINFEAPTGDESEQMIRYARSVRQIRIGENAADLYLSQELCQAWNLCSKCYTHRSALECGCAEEKKGKMRKKNPTAPSGATFSNEIDF